LSYNSKFWEREARTDCRGLQPKNSGRKIAQALWLARFFRLATFLHQDLDCLFKLEVSSLGDAFGIVANLDVRFDLSLLHKLAFFIPVTDLRDPE